MSKYKRGVIIKDGKHYGRYPDGTLYRLYDTDTPFITFVDKNNETFLRVRQATEQGYTDCPVYGSVDLAYPTSSIRRSRTVGGGGAFSKCSYLPTSITHINRS